MWAVSTEMAELATGEAWAGGGGGPSIAASGARTVVGAELWTKKTATSWEPPASETSGSVVTASSGRSRTSVITHTTYSGAFFHANGTTFCFVNFVFVITVTGDRVGFILSDCF